MRFTYTIAQAMAVAAFVVGWIPTVSGWAFHDPRAVLCWLTAVVLLVVPFAYDEYGSDLKLSHKR